MGPCAKLRVSCTLLTSSGVRFTGTNDCANPQPVCPREPGEGYEKCISICQQEGHAERVAIKRAGRYADGAFALITGHDHACRECQHALYEAGVVSISFPGWKRTPPHQ